MRRSDRIRGLLFATVCALLVLPALARAQPQFAETRLEGQFQMTGQVTVAHAVPGEFTGEAVMRFWTFTPLCPVGSCANVALSRPRANGVDTLVLTQQTAGYYVGGGVFYEPLRCAGRLYQRGEAVPFTITVQVTADAVVDGVDIATGINATYTNRSRRNLTRCVGALGHDAAAYTGIWYQPA